MGNGALGGTSDHPYRGEDRRRRVVEIRPPVDGHFVAAAVALVAWWAMWWITEPRAVGPVDVDAIGDMLAVVATVATITLAVLAYARWRLNGDATALWLCAAAAVQATVGVALVQILPRAVPTAGVAAIAAGAAPAALLATVALALRAGLAPPVDTGQRFVRAMMTGFAGCGVVAGVALAVPATATPLRIAGAVAGLGVAAFLARRGQREQRRLLAWSALWIGCAALVATTRGATNLDFGHAALQVAGVMAACYGAARELLTTYAELSGRLAVSEHVVRSDREAAEERAHEARSALAAIEGATRTLEHYREQLPPETRESLSAAVRGEIRRMQRLVSPSPAAPERRVAFSVVGVVGPLVATERSRGTDVGLHVPAEVSAHGDPGVLAEVLQTLFDNARRYAAGTRLTVSVAADGGRCVIDVADRGPGVSPHQRRAIFGRGVRGDASTAAPGSGLGLYVARRLLHEDGGDLWVEDAGPGAVFRVALAGASAVGEVMHGGHDAREVAEPQTAAALGRRD